MPWFRLVFAMPVAVELTVFPRCFSTIAGVLLLQNSVPIVRKLHFLHARYSS
jgi:hypothetical protein